MIHVTKVTLTRAEGLSELCGKPVEFTGQDVFGQVRKHTDKWDHTYPESGYDKHDFEIVWEDGETYNGRLDCSRAWGTSKNSMTKHIQSNVGYYYERQKAGDPEFSIEAVGDAGGFMKDRVGFLDYKL